MGLLTALLSSQAYAQESKSLHLIFPSQNDWNVVPEGSNVRFDLKASAAVNNAQIANAVSAGNDAPLNSDLSQG